MQGSKGQDFKTIGWFEALLCLIFPYTDIERDNEPGVIYLRRWFLYPRDKDFGKNKGKGRLYLHKFYLGDSDDFLHDHPWRFSSLILTRGYWEETAYSAKDKALSWLRNEYEPLLVYNESAKELRIRKFYSRFSLLKRPAEWRHRVILKDTKPVWTIVKTGVKERSWGFWIHGKMCPWRNFHNGKCE